MAAQTLAHSMTKADRTELRGLVKLRVKLIKEEVDQRGASQLADMEAQLAAEYSDDHPAWVEMMTQARADIAKVDAEIARRCQLMGLPEKFRPSARLSWSCRGENAMPGRRAELRRAGEARVDANVRAAKLKMEHWGVDQLTAIAKGALESEEAKAFLESMPSIEELMPPVDLPRLAVLSGDEDEEIYRDLRLARLAQAASGEGGEP